MTVSPKEFLDKVNNKELLGFWAFWQRDQLSNTKQNTTQMENEQIEASTPNNNSLKSSIVKNAIDAAAKIGKWDSTKDALKSAWKGILKDMAINAFTSKMWQKVTQELTKWAWQLEQQKAKADEIIATKTDTEAKMASVDGKYVTNYEKSFNDINHAYLWDKATSALSVFDSMKDYWQSTDWTSTYLTDWTHVIKQPTLHSIDTSSLMQSAYNDITYILANEGKLLTSQELKELYPEYEDISEASLDRFIWACAYDVLDKWEKTDIQVFADYFWEISLNDNYTSEKQALLDLMSDEWFLSLWWDWLYYDEVEVYATLANIANQLKDLWYNADGASDWWLLQAYKDLEFTDGEGKTRTVWDLLKAEDSIDKKKLTRKIDEWKERYDTNMANVEVLRKNWEENPQYQILLNTVSNISQYIEEHINNVNMQKMWEGKYRPLIMWNYYLWADWSYYHPDGSIMYRLTTNESGQDIYVDEEWNEVQELSALRWWFARSIVWILENWLEKSWEIPLDISLSATASEMWWKYDSLRDMYAYQALWDIITIWFDTMMDGTIWWLGFQMLSETPGVWKPVDKAFYTVLNWLWSMVLGTANLMWITDGWTDQWKQELKDVGWQLAFLFLWMKKEDIKNWAKEKIKSNPKLFAEIEWLRAYVDEFVLWLAWMDARTTSEWIQRKKREADAKTIDKVKEEKVTEWKEVVDVTPAKDRVWVKISKIQAIHQEAIRSAEAAYENAYVYSSVAKNWKTVEVAFEELKQMSEDAKKVEEFEAKMAEARNAVAKEVSIDTQINDTISSLNTLARNVVEWYENLSKPQWEATSTEGKMSEKPTTTEDVDTKLTRQQRKLQQVEDKAMTKAKLDIDEQAFLRSNPLVPLIEHELFKHIQEERNKKWEITKYVEKDSPKEWEIAENLLEELYKDVEKVLKVMWDWKEELHRTIYSTLSSEKTANIASFWTKENLSSWTNDIAKYFRDGEIWIFVDDEWNLVARYTWKDITMDIRVEAAIDALNEALEIYNDATKWRWSTKFSEKNLMDIQQRLGKIWYGKTGPKSTDIAKLWREIYHMYNEFLDNNNLAPRLRAWDKASRMIHQWLEYLESLVSKNLDVRENARNRLLSLSDEEISNIATFIPDIKAYIDLVKFWPKIVQKLKTQFLKTDFVHKLNANVARYWIMMWVAGVIWATFPWILGKSTWIPIWSYLWRKAKEKFKKRPINKVNKPILNMLWLPEDVTKLLQKREEGLKQKASELEKVFRAIISDAQADIPQTNIEVTNSTLASQGSKYWMDEFIDAYNAYTTELSDFYADIATEIQSEYENILSSKWETAANKFMANVMANAVTSTEVSPEWNGMTDVQKSTYVLEKFENLEPLSEPEMKVLWDTLSKIWWAEWAAKQSFEGMSSSEQAKYAFMVADAKEMMKKWEYKKVQKEIEKNEWIAKAIYERALRSMQESWTAPTADIEIDYDYVGNKKNIKPSAAYSTEGTNIAEKEMEKSMVKWYDSRWDWYKAAIKSIVAEMLKKDLNEPTDEMIDKSKASQFFESENYDDTRANYDTIYSDVMDYYTDYGPKDKTTTSEQAENIKIKEKEWDRLEKEVWLLTPEQIKIRENLRFSFDNLVKKPKNTKKGHQSMVRDDGKWNQIVNKDNLDIINNWTVKDWAMIKRGENWEETTITVTWMEVFDNVPWLKELPDDVKVHDLSTDKTYTLEEIKKEDFVWETNKKDLEKYYEEFYNSIPDDIKDLI